MPLLPLYSLQQLVYDKEKRLRMMMKMHGLNDTVYWLVNYVWYYIIYAIYVIIFCVLGAIVKLEVFRKTSIGGCCWPRTAHAAVSCTKQSLHTRLW
jgi:hypothetical protein